MRKFTECVRIFLISFFVSYAIMFLILGIVTADAHELCAEDCTIESVAKCTDTDKIKCEVDFEVICPVSMECETK